MKPDPKSKKIATYLYLGDQYTGVSSEASECHRDVIIQFRNLPYGSGVLQLCHGLPLDTEHDTVTASNADYCRAALDSLHRVLNLE